MKITHKLLAAYAANHVSQEERLIVRQYLMENPSMLESVVKMMDDSLGITLDEPEPYLQGLCSPSRSVASGSVRYRAKTEIKQGHGFAASFSSDCSHFYGLANSFSFEEQDSVCEDSFSTRLDELVDLLDDDTPHDVPHFLPMTAMAADNAIDNLCAIRCEGIALRHLGIVVSDTELVAEAKAEGWLQPEGTAIHHIGRLSGTRGLCVTHRYDCSISDIQVELSRGNVVIAVVDGGELNGDWAAERMEDLAEGYMPDHAVIVIEVQEETIIIQDSATPQVTDVYPIVQFADAWADSSNYMIIIAK